MAPKKSTKGTKSAASADDDNVGHHIWTVEEEDLLIDLWEENDLLYLNKKKTRSHKGTAGAHLHRHRKRARSRL